MPTIKKTCPTPLFDTQDQLAAQQLPETIVLPFPHRDFHAVKDFLLQYAGSRDTYTSLSPRSGTIGSVSMVYSKSRSQ